MTEWIAREIGGDVPLHFTAFHPDFRMLDRPATPPSTLTRARKIALSKGLRYIYTGNVHDPGGSSTYCHNCGEVLIERDWYQLGAYNLKDKNKCTRCGTVCAGHFDDKPGTWGPRRQPVRLADF